MFFLEFTVMLPTCLHFKNCIFNLFYNFNVLFNLFLWNRIFDNYNECPTVELVLRMLPCLYLFFVIISLCCQWQLLQSIIHTQPCQRSTNSLHVRSAIWKQLSFCGFFGNSFPVPLTETSLFFNIRTFKFKVTGTHTQTRFAINLTWNSIHRDETTKRYFNTLYISSPASR